MLLVQLFTKLYNMKGNSIHYLSIYVRFFGSFSFGGIRNFLMNNQPLIDIYMQNPN